jgi:hypothetical protein
MKDLGTFYIQNTLNQIAVPVKNAFRLRDGSLLVETRTDSQIKKLLKEKLLGPQSLLG